MKSLKFICQIIVAALSLSFTSVSPLNAQTAEVQALSQKVVELSQSGKYVEAMRLVEESLITVERKFGPDHADLAFLLSQLADLYADQKRFAETRPFLERALAIREKAFGPDHLEVAQAQFNLAGVYVFLNRYTDAEDLYTRALIIREKAYGPVHPAVAVLLHHQAILYAKQGRLSETVSILNRVAGLANEVLVLSQAGKYAEAAELAQLVLAIYQSLLGSTHLNVATSLNNLAEVYRNQGRYADAEYHYGRALLIIEKLKAIGPTQVVFAKVGVMYNLAQLYVKQGYYAEAARQLFGVLAILEQAPSRNDYSVAMVRRELAEFERKFGPQALIELKAMEEIEALDTRGARLFDQGRFAEALPITEQAVKLAESRLGPNHRSLATPLNNLGELYRYFGQYVEAERLIKRALAIAPNTVQTLNILGALYTQQGRYAEAERQFQRALVISVEMYGDDHISVALTLTNLTAVFNALGRHAEARGLLLKAFQIEEKARGRYHTNVATILNNLGETNRILRRYAEGEDYFKRSLEIYETSLGRDHASLAPPLNNLGLLYLEADRYDEAEPHLKRALTILEKHFGPDHSELASILMNLGELHRKQGQLIEAEADLKRGLEIYGKVFGRLPPSVNVALGLNNLGIICLKQGRYGESESYFKQSLEVFEKHIGGNHPAVARVWDNLTILYEQQNRYSEALFVLQRLLTERRAAKFTGLSVLMKSRVAGIIDKQQAFSDSYELIQRDSATAASYAVSRLASRFAASTDELALRIRQDQDLIAELIVIDQSLTKALSKPTAERGAAHEETLLKRQAAIVAQRAKLEELFRRDFPDYSALSGPQPVTVKDTQALLAIDEMLVIFDFGTISHAWIVTSTTADWIELKITAKELDTQVQLLREPLTSQLPDQVTGLSDLKNFDTKVAHDVYRQTFGVIEQMLNGKSRLSVVTNGAFTSLPLHLLVTKDPAGKSLRDIDWLVRSHSITIWPSVSSLQVLRGKSAISKATKPLIAFADPVFSKEAYESSRQRSTSQGRQRRQQSIALRSITDLFRGEKLDVVALREMLPQLPGTRREVQAIAEQLKADASDVKLGQDATKTAVKQAKLDQYQIVYFATHGLVAGFLEHFSKTKAEPALALTFSDQSPRDGEEEGDDGLLTASEIALLKLNAEWVVLSACNTAAADAPGAEALSGLARAFFYAGARSLLVSHWEVSDDSTAQLMINAFKAATQDSKLSHAQALRQSMLAMLDNKDSEIFSHPRFWAPFVVVGEPATPRN